MTAGSPGASPATIVRLVGVYDADGTLRGELTYWIGARLGRAHCALCDITHGTFRERGEWRSCRERLPVPFDTFHRNDQPRPIRTFTGDQAPVVVAETDRGLVIMLGPGELAECGGAPERLAGAVIDAARHRGLGWATG